MIATLIWSFLIYLVILYVVNYVVVEFGQNYLYDEVTPGAPLKVALGAVILAALMTWTRSNFATMFTSEFGPTVFLAIIWVGVFILVFRFQPWHGFGLSVATMLIFAGMATLVVDSLTAPKPPGRIDVNETNKPIRRSNGGPGMVNPGDMPATKSP